MNRRRGQEQAPVVAPPARPDAPPAPPVAGEQPTENPIPIEDIGVAIVVRPQDFLVIRVAPDVDQQTFMDWAEQARREIPEDLRDRVVFAAGEQLSVIRGAGR